MKLVIGIILTALSFVAAILGFVFYDALTGFAPFLGVVAFAIIGYVAGLFIKSYSADHGNNAVAVIFTILTAIQYYVLFGLIALFITVINIFMVMLGKDKLSIPGKETVYTINDEHGLERKLKEFDRYGGVRYYKDDLNNTWCSSDEGKTFYRD